MNTTYKNLPYMFRHRLQYRQAPIHFSLYDIGKYIRLIDATIIAQRPKMAPHIEQMRDNIAQALHLERGQVNIKATTEEGLGFTGSGEGISAQAIVYRENVSRYPQAPPPQEERP